MAITKTVTKKAPAKAEKTAAPEGTLEAKSYSMGGEDLGTITLPTEIFGAKWRPDLVHQVTTAIEANLRQNRAHTKDRAEVRGGGKKPWKQKGTGQARHGSRRSPIWRGGGVALGPRSTRDYSEKVNKKMRREALLSVLSKKAQEGEVLFVDSLTFAAPKTAEAKRFVTVLAGGANVPTLATKRKNAALIALTDYEPGVIKSFRNMGNVATEEVRNLNALNVLSHKYLIIENPKESFTILSSRAKSKD
jgi:large subunit ribosomal protein L4